jgi:hypothetical protein
MTPERLTDLHSVNDDDVILATFLEEAFVHYVHGDAVRPADLLAQSPRLIPAAKQLLADAHDLFRAARGLRGRSRLLRSELFDQTTENIPAPNAPPNPFPHEFRVIQLLGQGVFGSVWLADDLHLGRRVALKMIGPADSTGEAGLRLARLRDEANLLATVRHPNVVQIYAWRESQIASGTAAPLLVLQFVPGGSLAERVRQEGPLPWETAARYAADVAAGLLAVHAAGIVHRDVKPANILWDSAADEALLTDFGISTRLADPNGRAGTPFYMPPEAFTGRVGTPQDVYGLSATLFWLVTGSVPFPEIARDRLLAQIAHSLPDPDPRCAALPAALEKLIRAGLAADPHRRPSLPAFCSELRGVLNQLLADSLALPSAEQAACRPRLTVSRQVNDFTFVPVTTSRPAPEGLVRDLKRVPPEPARADLCTGQRVRVEVECDRDGFVTVFNVGPTGNLHVLFPEIVAGMTQPAQVPAGHPLYIPDIALTPPAGRERLFALWSREALPLRLGELLGIAERGEAIVSGAYRATRDMERIRRSVKQLGQGDWCVTVLELDHRTS